MTADEPTGPDRSLLKELRHRGVIGVAVVYGVVGWTLVQVADAVFPGLGLPDWSVTLVIALILLGFPLALVLAWAFERTQGGVQRAEAAPRRRIAAALVLGLASMAVLAFLLAGSRVEAEGGDYSTIVVLPFEDLSPGDQAYFSEGIAEELMSVLATVPDLDVVGRASAFAVRDRAADLEEIGTELGADVVLDGSVRRDGDDLRISVQLIDVADGRVLWSRRYDRRAGDIFALQDEIATAVAGEVETRLTLPPPPEADAARLRAHDLYLQGLAAWHRRTPEEIEAAARLFERATVADSTYAPAHAGVALTHALLPLFVADTTQDHAEIALRAARRALALDSTLAEAHAALSQRAMVLTWDRETAVAEARKAIELRPSYATGWQWYAEALATPGRTDEALAAIDRAVELNPLAPAARNVRAAILFKNGDKDAALREIREAIQRFPDVPLFADGLFTIGVCTGDTTLIREGGARLDALSAAHLEAISQAIRSPTASEARRQALDELAATLPTQGTLRLAMLMAELGEHDDALRLIEEVIEAGDDPSLLYLLPFPCFDPLREDPRFQELVSQLDR